MLRYNFRISIVCLYVLVVAQFVFAQNKLSKAEDRNFQQPGVTNSDKSAEFENDEIIKCADNGKDCFIRAAKNCHPATLTDNVVVDFGSDKFSQTVFYFIKDGSLDKCRFYLKILSWEVKAIVLSEEEKEAIKKKLINEGFKIIEQTEEQKKRSQEMREAMEKRMKDHVETNGTCSFTAAKLSALFERWREGKFSSEDYKGANCRGTYFTEANGFPKGF